VAAAIQSTIHIPTPLRRFTGELGEISVAGGTVGEALRDLVRQHPALERHLYTPEGTLRSFVNVFKNDDDVRFLDKGATPVADGDVLSIIPSIAGGVGTDHFGSRP
jgi:molybdopterin converting factor small subunit